MREEDLEALIYKAFRASGAFLPQSVKEVAAAEAEMDESTVELPDSLRDPAVILRGRRMTGLQKLIEGLKIFERLNAKNVWVDHAVIYCGTKDKSALSEEDKKKLADLGWHWDDEREVFGRYV